MSGNFAFGSMRKSFTVATDFKDPEKIRTLDIKYFFNLNLLNGMHLKTKKFEITLITNNSVDDVIIIRS